MHWEVDGRLFCAGTSHILFQKKFHRSTWDDKLQGWAVEKVPAPERLRPLRMHDGGVGSQCSCVSVHPLKCSHQVLFYIYFHISLSLIVINSHNVDNWKEMSDAIWFGLVASDMLTTNRQTTKNSHLTSWAGSRLVESQLSSTSLWWSRFWRRTLWNTYLLILYCK